MADTLTRPPYLVVFDVESVGLHGQGFAVGAVAYHRVSADESAHVFYQVVEEMRGACLPVLAEGDPSDALWVSVNVLPHLVVTHSDPREVRRAFWGFWQTYAAAGALLAADVPWPVEAAFLQACIADDPLWRKHAAPYPLLDVASVLWARGVDPRNLFERRPDELPVHDPLADARQSARILLDHWPMAAAKE